ncbi:MAG: CehA/McbA family metallohydrolase [Clostridia bacterium]|nr:CehA/McbA family metallohydrolase [Clostridia bacterium]
MLPTPRNYAVWPAVVLAGKETHMTIIAEERAFLAFEDVEYTLKIVPINGDETDYYDAPVTHRYLTFRGHNGALEFDYTFEEEMEYRLQLYRDETLLEDMRVYALEEDLYALTPLRGDLHGHSYRSDGRRDPAALAGHYREQGYDFFALTDHNRFYPGGEIDEAYEGVDTGFARVRGEEVHAPGCMAHIVHVGGKRSVAAQYVNDKETYEKQLAECETRVPENVPEVYRKRYACLMWVSERIHEAGGLAIFAHPFWRPAKSMVNNVQEPFAKLLLKSGMFDAYEVVGGVGQVNNNLSLNLWNDMRAEGVKIPAVASSDVHKITEAASFPHHFTVCFAEKNENDAIASAVKNGLCVAVEAMGDEYRRCYRCYGSLRLVNYAHFLLANYFAPMQRLCQGTGVMMRAYAMEECDKAVIEGMTRVCHDWRDRFFGRKAAHLPGEKIRAFEEKWRDAQMKGPKTKGSRIYGTDKVTRQI